MSDSRAARGSDDEYCSAYPPEPHDWLSISVQAPPLGWVQQCSLCGRINNADLRRQIAMRPHHPAPPQER